MTTTRRTFIGLAAALPILAATKAQAATHTITIKNMAFSPANLTIARGDTVTWVNEDNAGHSAWDDAGNTFDTGILRRGASASLTFNSAGSVSYRCRPHARMRGTITIT